VTRLSDWAIPPRVWSILASWGLAVLVIAGLLYYWVYDNQRRAERDLCTMVGVFLSDPEPPAGPAGERSRVVRAAMRTFYEQRDCPR
jgi:cbb3-type cytochrome oxidase subunit 3